MTGPTMTPWSKLITAAATAAALASTAAGAAASCRADEAGYLVNVTVRPGYHFPDAASALSYGYRLCDSIRHGEDYPALAHRIKSDFGTADEFEVSYLLSQATQELCPGLIWQLRQSAADYVAAP